MNSMIVGLIVWVVASAVTIGLTLRHDVVSDEAWILVVAERVQLRRDVLYRDVFFGVAPLPLWLLLAATRRTGIEVAALRWLNGACTGVLTAALWLAGRTLGMPWWCVLIVAAVAVLACGPVADLLSWYENLSRAGVAVALCLTLDGRPWALIGAGAAIGIALMSKYTIGLVAGPALLGLAWTTAHDRWWLVAAGVAAMAVVALSVAPLTRAEGALRAMWLRLGPGKRSFVEHGRISLWDLVRHRRQRVVTMALVVPFAVASLPLAAWAWHEGAPVVFPWTVAVALSTFWSCTWPRADSTHLRSGLPFALFAVLAATEALQMVHPSMWITTFRLGVLVWALLLVAAGLRYAVGRGAFRRRERRVRGCRGAGCRYDDAMLRDLWIASELSGGAALLLGVDAPYAALVSGIHNPTAYDYPLASAFGLDGQRDVAARIRDGRVGWVLEVEPMPTAMAPVEVEAAVADHTEIIWQSAAVRLRRSLATQR